MSSESDADEFYDAEDISPGRPKRLHHASSISSVGSASSITSDGLSAEGPIIDLEEEERKLLEAQQLEEERRRIEDEARQKRLEELQEKKKRQHEQALLAMQEAQKKAEANRLRRQKLAEARGIMADESTPPAAKPPPSLTGEETPLDTSLEACANFHSCMDVSANITESESIECAISRDESSDSLHDQNNSSESLGVENESSETLVSSELDEGENVNVNLNQPGKNGDKLQSKKIPEDSPVEHKDTNMEPVIIVEPEAEPEKPEETPVLVVTELDKHEPDIVKSVRGRPAELAQSMAMEAGPSVPVAPPRRKKKKAPSPIPEGVIAHSVSECSLQTMPIELPTPTTTVANLTKELEESLSLQSATSGNFLVTTQEEESSKAVRTADEEREDKRCYARLHALDFKSATLPSTFKKTPSSSPTEEKTSERPLSCDAGEAKCSKASETTEKTRSLERPRTASGSRYLTDKEVLERIMLDPVLTNPLSLHIMRRTKEFSSDSSLHKGGNSDEDDHEESTKEPVTTQTIRAVKPIKKRGIKIKRFLGKSVRKIKNKADGVLHHGDQVDSSDEEDDTLEGRRLIKIKASSHHKGPYDFDLLVPVQEVVGDHNATPGAIWTMKFSHCGRLLATGGQDNLLRVWVLKDAYAFFDDMRQKYTTKVSPTPSQDSLSSQSSEASQQNEMQPEEEDEHSPFMRRPFYVYKGHTADLLDISWSKNYFILSSSMDKTVRLWHVSRKECLCCFQHIDFVTAIAFHPRDDRYFLSGSLDGKLRLWNIPDKKVTLWNEVIGPTKLITAANFCNNGRFAVVGTYDGRCIFYTTDQLKYSTQIHVRSTRGKNSRGRKITGIEEAPGEDKILVTSNDSRIRLYNRRDLTLTCKYKGCANNSSQIKASFSSNGKYIICGSEDHFVYIWRTQHDFHQFTSARRDRNDFWEGIKAHQAVVTAAIFAPKPSLIIKSQFEYVDDEDKDSTPEVRGEVLVSADFSGQIKVFINKFKPGSGL